MKFVPRFTNGRVVPECETDEAGTEPVCRVLEGFWMADPVAFLTAVRDRRGLAREGVLGFQFSDGRVACQYFNEKKTIEESAFVGYAGGYARAALQLAGAHGQTVKGQDEIRKILEDL